MIYHMKRIYIVLAIALVFLGSAQSQLEGKNNSTENNTWPKDISELRPSIAATVEVYEKNPNAFTVHNGSNREPAKQEIYHITVANNGEVPINNIVVFAEAQEGMMFANSAYYDDSGNLKIECDQSDLCEEARTKLTLNLDNLDSKENISMLVDAYLRPNVDNKQLNIKVYGSYSNEAVSDLEYSAKVVEKKPEWSDAFATSKYLIKLGGINVSNAIVAIKPSNREWNTENFKSYTPKIADQVMYQISVHNMDSTYSIRNISIFDYIPKGMIYVQSSIIEDQSASSQILPNNVGANTITWNIDEIKPNTKKVIKYIVAFLDISPRRFENRANAEWTWDTENALIEDKSQFITISIPL